MSGTSRNERNPVNNDLFGSASVSHRNVAFQNYGLRSKDVARSSMDGRTKTSSFEFSTHERGSTCAHRPCCKGSMSYITRNLSNLNLSIKSRRSSNNGGFPSQTTLQELQKRQRRGTIQSNMTRISLTKSNDGGC